MTNQSLQLPAALSNLIEPAAVSMYLNREWQIDWGAVLARRPRILEHEQALPPYFVLPEILTLLEKALHSVDHLMIDTVWHTGARVSELLALTPSSFHIDIENNDSFVSLQTLKKPRRGHPAISKRQAGPPKRMVPLRNGAYLDRVQRHLETFKTKPNERIFSFTRQTANNRLKRIAAQLPNLPFEPSVHTLRHSFAINCVIHGAPIRILQMWMGHSNIASTEIYTRVLGTETAHFMDAIQFQSKQTNGVLISDANKSLLE
ncbi:MAG: tyrosine-type recombinase/integrase [Pseudomonadales bacterium]|nr:tyrosine-type recombinase/integrase [Pseudomonadales bacterium]